MLAFFIFKVLKNGAIKMLENLLFYCCAISFEGYT